MADYHLVAEGICPIHRHPLERSEHFGWCRDCDLGWSIEGDRVTTHKRADHPGGLVVDYVGPPDAPDQRFQFRLHPGEDQGCGEYSWTVLVWEDITPNVRDVVTSRVNAGGDLG